LGSAVWLTITGTALADTAVPAQPATKPTERKIEAKSPGEVAAQICAILDAGPMPWQLYRSYAGMFVGFADRQARVPVATREAMEQRQRLVAHYQGMAKLLQQMQECAALRDGIKFKQIDIPFGERQTKYKEAKEQHEVFLKQFVVMGSKLPGFRLPKDRAQANAARSSKSR
jgi:hypothetical protein